MNGKRFTMEKSMVGGGNYNYDNRTDFQYPTTPYGIWEIFCQKLDELSDENEELKNENRRLKKKIAYYEQHYVKRTKDYHRSIEEWASGGH